MNIDATTREMRIEIRQGIRKSLESHVIHALMLSSSLNQNIESSGEQEKREAKGAREGGKGARKRR